MVMKKIRFVVPGSSLPGKRFEPREELSLHTSASQAAANLPGKHDSVLMLPEMPSPLGLPDFAILVGGEAWLHERQLAGVTPIVSEVDCRVLDALYAGRPSRLDSIAEKVGWASYEIEPILARLERVGAAHKTRNGSFLLNPALQPKGTLIAIEAKVKDWQKAVLQGRAYRTWANNYVVVLGEVGAVAATRARDRIVADGGGLFLASKWQVRPSMRRHRPPQRLRGFEYLYAAVGSSVPALGLAE